MKASVSPLESRSFRRDKLAWVFTVLLLVCAGGYGFYWHKFPENQPPPSIDKVNDNPRIVILAYDRIVNKNTNQSVTTSQLREHINALITNGFKPINVKALHEFYYKNIPLPEKPVLLMFDNGYLDNYVNVHNILVETGWRAAISLLTVKQQIKDTQYLYWDRLQRMINSGYWEILSHGSNTAEPVLINAHGETAPFMSSTMWLSEIDRQETPVEFSKRMEKDITDSIAQINDNLGVNVLGYVFRYSSPNVVYKNIDVIREERKIRQNLTPLAFVEDEFGVNSRHSNPHDLRRLRVSPQLSTAGLIDRINAALNFPDKAKTGIPHHKHWVPSEGAILIKPGLLEVRGSPRGLTWLSGSQWQQNWTLSARIRIAKGEFWLFQKDNDGTEWRFGGNDEGLYLKVIGTDSATNMLKSSETIPENDWHFIKVIRRGAGIWVEWDGEPLWEQPVLLPNQVTGSIGWLTWSESENSHLQLMGLSIKSIPYHAHTLPAQPSSEDVKAAIESSQTSAAIAPAQFTLDMGELQEHPVDKNLFRMLQHRYAWQMTPTITFMQDVQSTSQTRQLLGKLLKRAEQDNWNGLHLDISNVSHTNQSRLAYVFANLDNELKRSRRKLLITYSADTPPQAVYDSGLKFASVLP